MTETSLCTEQKWKLVNVKKAEEGGGQEQTKTPFDFLLLLTLRYYMQHHQMHHFHLQNVIYKLIVSLNFSVNSVLWAKLGKTLRLLPKSATNHLFVCN